MNSKLSNIFETIVNNSGLINEFFKIESKDSMYKFFLKISGDLSREEFEKYINTLEIASYEKQSLDSDNLEKIAGGLNKKNWTTMLSSSLIPLMSIGSVYPVGAVNVKNDILYKYVSENKSTIKKVAAYGIPFGFLTFGSVLLINYLVENQLPDFEKLENRIINLRERLANEKIKEFRECVNIINSNLVNKIKSKNLNIDTKNLTSKSGILIFNEQILKIIKDDSKYFKEDISCVVELLDYLIKNYVPYRGLSNAGCYCYINSAVQMLSADDELCDILSSDAKMRECFDNFTTRDEQHSYEHATSEFKNPINTNVKNKFLNMMRFVNAATDTESTPGGIDLAALLATRDQITKEREAHYWHQQGCPDDIFRIGVPIPDFVLGEGTTLGDPSARKAIKDCGLEGRPYICIMIGRPDDAPHSISIDFEELVKTDDGSEYKLISFACHRGDKRGGHWWAVRKDKSGNWWECNDSNVSNAGNSEKCLNNNRYKRGASFLLYKKIK